ncbi:MAG TPA: hypothetical protein VE961_17010 [Pyrinomonadaceae bacterium]|nr:hypothetical protein [Pyrinomonadaceae bacterium]
MSTPRSEDRRLPVRPNLAQLSNQAKDLLRAIRRDDPPAVAEFELSHPDGLKLLSNPPAIKLADAQLALARSYGAPGWQRLVQACKLVDAIWRDDLEAVKEIVGQNPHLIHESALITDRNWGPPMSYAANLGRNEIIRFLHSRGATDLEHAAGRAALQSHPETVRLIYDLAGRPSLENWSLAGPAYTLSVAGTAVLFTLGAQIVRPDGVDRNAMEHLLGSDSRNPNAKHRILEMYVEHGFDPPDTPVMAFHRGRIDLLETQLTRDPQLLTRTFDITEVYPLAPACAQHPHTAQGTPVHGTTLLHLAAYFDEIEIAEWLLDRGMDPNVRAATDPDGFGGYTALYSTVVSQHNFWVNYGKGRPDDARFTRLLLDRGASVNIRASIRAGREGGHGGGPLREYRDVTPLGWGEQYDEKIFVSRESLRLLREHGGG